jgi:hypothetical protein
MKKVHSPYSPGFLMLHAERERTGGGSVGDGRDPFDFVDVPMALRFCRHPSVVATWPITWSVTPMDSFSFLGPGQLDESCRIVDDGDHQGDRRFGVGRGDIAEAHGRQQHGDRLQSPLGLDETLGVRTGRCASSHAVHSSTSRAAAIADQERDDRRVEVVVSGGHCILLTIRLGR